MVTARSAKYSVVAEFPQCCAACGSCGAGSHSRGDARAVFEHFVLFLRAILAVIMQSVCYPSLRRASLIHGLRLVVPTTAYAAAGGERGGVAERAGVVHVGRRLRAPNPVVLHASRVRHGSAMLF